MIRAAQKVGLSIEEIKDALSTSLRQAPTAEHWERLAQHLRLVVGQRIDEPFALLNGSAPEPASKCTMTGICVSSARAVLRQ